MKLPEREFNIFNGERPKVLLLGNGLCRAYGGMSWDTLLDEIKDKETFPHPAKQYILPMPLKAALLANNDLSAKLRDLVKEAKLETDSSDKINWGSFVYTTDEMRDQIRRLVDCGFDYVLTTNYSYEIEAALWEKAKRPPKKITPNRIQKQMCFHEVDNAQTQFLINTFNMIEGTPVWHIHGEARKPDSMILGHYYYGRVLRRCVDRLDGSKEAKEDNKKVSTGKSAEFAQKAKQMQSLKISSWIDAFVLGDVYILGFGMDASEMDLWWLIEYKRNNKEFSGTTVFYEPAESNLSPCAFDQHATCDRAAGYVSPQQCKLLLLEKTYGVETKTLGITVHKDSDYKPFYDKAIEEIEKDLAKKVP